MKSFIAALALVVMIPTAQATETTSPPTQPNTQELIENLQEWWQNLQQAGSNSSTNEVVAPPSTETGVCIQTVQGPSVCN